MREVAKCQLCGEPMPEGESTFKFHGYSGPCPKPPLPKPETDSTAREIAARIWCDQEMSDVAMDVNAAEEIAKIIERVRKRDK